MTYGVLTEASSSIDQHVSRMEPNTFQTYGWVAGKHGWVLSTASKQNRKILAALDHHIRTILQYQGAIAARLGRGVATFAGSSPEIRGVLLWWDQDITNPRVFYMNYSAVLSTVSVAGAEGLATNT